MSLELIKTKENGINYLIHPVGSIFEGMKIRENPDEAFENAIKRGMKKPCDWGYMYSNNNRDYFKHYYSRGYISFPQFSLKERLKNKLYNLIGENK